ncbi:DUF3108 domain-containing protein [Janthinobacterium sp. PC23-8]|uniref:DUF3108 domain-containing protein n=1 Tax=Janthinobacterium sp. PC23-8 TaxID=2012679 RepID=UPI000B97C59A|nr:DUF3108 domain-containing protein [Janthinobacterium sp. PC23-8]OYO32006.1 hypothetical protein CD932_13380 [Janthinobacterium sp. PC23-8]
MTSASFFAPPRRRTVIFVALIGALHAVALHWLGAQTGRAPMHEQARLVSMAIVAEAPPPLETAPAPPVPLPPPPAPPLPVLPVVDLPQLVVPDAPQPLQVVAPAVPATETPAPALVQLPALAAPAETPPAPQPAVEQARRYKTNVPASAEFDLQVDRRDADGTKWTGVAAMSWQNKGDHYSLSLEVGLSMLITRINLLVLTSEGLIDASGVAPVKATEKRRGRSQTATHFDAAGQTIRFSATTATVPWQEGAQDKASLPFQLAAIGRADVTQLAGNIDILVGEEKEATVFRFQMVGEETLDTSMGRLQTWHLRRPPKPGSYSSQLDIWLAPAMQWYPVQIRNTEANGALTTQTVSKLTVTGS